MSAPFLLRYQYDPPAALVAAVVTVPGLGAPPGQLQTAMGFSCNFDGLGPVGDNEKE